MTISSDKDISQDQQLNVKKEIHKKFEATSSEHIFLFGIAY